MKQDIHALVDHYGRFEQRVREQMERRCRPSCSTCRRVCCRAHYCAETRESAFLQRVAERFSAHTLCDPLSGWLSPEGCTLVAGRPPVCYEFLCRDIPDAVAPDPALRHAMLALSMLVTHVGRRAIGARHLVTVTCDAELNRIKPEPFMTRLGQAQAGLQAALEMLDGRRSAAAVAALSRIAPPSRTDGQTIRRTM